MSKKTEHLLRAWFRASKLATKPPGGDPWRWARARAIESAYRRRRRVER